MTNTLQVLRENGRQTLPETILWEIRYKNLRDKFEKWWSRWPDGSRSIAALKLEFPGAGGTDVLIE